jgi:hypothetical protein
MFTADRPVAVSLARARSRNRGEHAREVRFMTSELASDVANVRADVRRLGPVIRDASPDVAEVTPTRRLFAS